jgi:Mn-dependent DtxR family transcriptional regulator
LNKKRLIDSDFIQKYNEGLSQQELSAYFCVSPTTVQVYMKRLKLQKRGLVDKIDKERFIKMWNDGCSLSKIGRKFWLCNTTISRIASRLGLQERELHRSTTKVSVASEPKLASTISKLVKPEHVEDKPIKSIHIAPTLGEIRKKEQTKAIKRAEQEYKQVRKEGNTAHSLR